MTKDTFDADLMRKILEAYAPLAPGQSHEPIDVEGYEREQIVYHERLLSDREFIIYKQRAYIADPTTTLIPQRLTYAGHEFLAQARDDTLWKKAKDLIAEKGLGITIELLKAVLTALTMQEMGLS